MERYLSIDIGGTNIKYGTFDRAGQVLESSRTKTPDNLTEFMTTLETIIDQYIDGAKGIAISSPGKIDTDAGIIYFGGALPYLHKLALGPILSDKYQVPVALENDGKAAALAELWLGNLKGCQNGAAIVLGTGVGGGIILDGQLRQGVHHQAGELSFLINNKDATDMNRFTALNTSAVYMIQSIAKALALPDLKDGAAVFAAIQAGNPTALTIFNQFCQNVAILIMNIQAIVDVEHFVIGGGISAQPILTQHINQAFDAYRESIPHASVVLSRPTIVNAHFQNEANLYGALYNLLLKIDA